MLEQKERSPRKRTYKQAFVHSKETGGNKPCILRNISDSGALLQFDDANGLPMYFTVKVELDAFEVPAQWIRREDEHVGVKFTDSPKYFKAERVQVLKSPDDLASRRSAEEIELKKQLFEMRHPETLGPAEEPTHKPDPRGFLAKRSKGFGKR